MPILVAVPNISEGFPIGESIPGMCGKRLAYINSNEVLQRFAHLQSLYVQMASVEKVIDPRFAFMICLHAD